MSKKNQEKWGRWKTQQVEILCNGVKINIAIISSLRLKTRQYSNKIQVYLLTYCITSDILIQWEKWFI
jgi:hypothetical protein